MNTKATDLEPVTGSTELAPLADFKNDVDISDINVPSIRLQHALADYVRKGLAKEGDVLLTFGNDDPEPRYLVGGPDKVESFTAYILAREKTAATTANGIIEWQKQRDPDDNDSWDVYFYYLAIPSFEPMIPVRVMLWKTAGMIPARHINTAVLRNGGLDEPIAMKFTVDEKKSRDGKYTYKHMVAVNTTADPDEMELAKAQMHKVHALNSRFQKENDAPVITDQPSFD